MGNGLGNVLHQCVSSQRKSVCDHTVLGIDQCEPVGVFSFFADVRWDSHPTSV